MNQLNTVVALERLDSVTEGRPTLLKDDSKHNRWANSRALELAGIDTATPNPEGGEIMRDGTGQATGVLVEAGGVLVEKTFAQLQPTPLKITPGQQPVALRFCILMASQAFKMQPHHFN